MAIVIKTKDPSEKLDYYFDWTNWLGATTLADSTWEIPDGLTVTTDYFTAKVAYVWVEGGTVGERYAMVNTIRDHSSPPRTAQRTMILNIEEK